MIVEVFSVALIVLGAAIALVGSIGLARFPDVFTRLHGPTKATTFGVGSVLLGTILYLIGEGDAGVIRGLLIPAFLFLTAPVSGHLIAKAALHRHCKSVCDIPREDAT